MYGESNFKHVLIWILWLVSLHVWITWPVLFDLMFELRNWRQLAAMYLSMKNSDSDRQLGYLRSLVFRYWCYEEYFGRKSRWWRPLTVFVVLPYIYLGFIQQVTQDISLALFTAAPLSGRLLVRSLYCSTVAIASYTRVSRGCGCVRANHSTGLPYDKFVITIVERNTWETSLIHCLRYCCSCFVLVIILGNELMIFPSIVFYYGN